MSCSSMRPRRLVLVGSVLVDVLMYVPHMPERGGDVLASQAIVTTGGGYNVLVGASRLGMPVAYAGKVGTGLMGMQVRRDLAHANVPILLPPAEEEDTGFDVGLVEPDGERSFVTSPGVESKLFPSDLNSIPLQEGDAVYVSGYDLCYPVSGESLGEWLPSLPPDVMLVLDPGPLVGDVPIRYLYKVLAHVDIISLNARELAILTGIDELAEGMERIKGMLTGEACAIVRVGAAGCWVCTRGHMPQYVPPRPAKVLDSTGAGDAHVAAFLASLYAGCSIEVAAWRANIAASMAVERIGPATCPSAEELSKELARLQG